MERFDLEDDDIERLRTKFEDFRKKRNEVLMLLVSYISDYCALQGPQADRQRRLRKKYAGQTPRLNYPIRNEGGFYWSVYNISVLLGRNRSSITRTLAKIKKSEEGYARLKTLRKTAKLRSGLSICVYHQDIFDLLMDQYEDEYLMRFANPRRGNPDHAPDIRELRRFWKYLKSMESVQKRTFEPGGFKSIASTERRGVLRDGTRRVMDFLSHLVEKVRRWLHI